MSEPIKAGDLVMYVRSHCPDNNALGKVFSVDGIEADSYCTCLTCKGITNGVMARIVGDDGTYWCPPSWLKRIPPLEELDDVKRDEEITA